MHEDSSCKTDQTQKVFPVRIEITEAGIKWRGKEIGKGHYDLSCISDSDPHHRATLHRFPNSKFLEVYCARFGDKGGYKEEMWRISLEKGEIVGLMTYFFPDEEEDGLHPGECHVRLLDRGIEVIERFVPTEGEIKWVGREIGNGHYDLSCISDSDPHHRATLHRSPNNKFFEGHWMFEGDRGMWRISVEK